MIPGTVGAGVAQNIGAYGQEVVNTLVSIEALNRNTLKNQVFSPKSVALDIETFFKRVERKYNSSSYI